MVLHAVSGDELGRAVRSLVGRPSAAHALESLADLLVPDLADFCLADLIEPPDLVTRVVARGRSGALDLPAELGPAGARRSAAETVGLLARLSGSAGRLTRLGPDELAAMAASDEPRLRTQGELALRLGAAEALVLGLSDADALLGVLVLGRTRGTFAPDEVARLTDVALLAGLVLDRLRLREAQRSVSTALQRSLLPRLPVVPGLEVAARFVPATQGLAVGGDWYDAFVLPSGQVALVVGDATGHDVQAAVRMAELRNLLRALAADQLETPADTLVRLDRVVAHLAPALSGTCVYAQVEHEGGRRRLRWSSAGHLPPVLLRDGRAELLETPPDLMLGVHASTPRAEHVRDLQEGDVVLLYTDGLVEERHTGLDERLQVLLQQAEAGWGDTPEQLADRLVRELAPGDDDVAVLVVRVVAASPG